MNVKVLLIFCDTSVTVQPRLTFADAPSEGPVPTQKRTKRKIIAHCKPLFQQTQHFRRACPSRFIQDTMSASIFSDRFFSTSPDNQKPRLQNDDTNICPKTLACRPEPKRKSLRDDFSCRLQWAKEQRMNEICNKGKPAVEKKHAYSAPPFQHVNKQVAQRHKQKATSQRP